MLQYVVHPEVLGHMKDKQLYKILYIHIPKLIVGSLQIAGSGSNSYSYNNLPFCEYLLES